MQRGARARGTKSKERIARIEELKAQPAPQAQAALQIQSTASRLGKKILTLSHLHKQMGERVLIEDFSAPIARDARIGIVGKKRLWQVHAAQAHRGDPLAGCGRGGARRYGAHRILSAGIRELDPSRTVLQSVCDIAGASRHHRACSPPHSVLETFLFPQRCNTSAFRSSQGGRAAAPAAVAAY